MKIKELVGSLEESKRGGNLDAIELKHLEPLMDELYTITKKLEKMSTGLARDIHKPASKYSKDAFKWIKEFEQARYDLTNTLDKGMNLLGKRR